MSTDFNLSQAMLEAMVAQAIAAGGYATVTQMNTAVAPLATTSAVGAAMTALAATVPQPASTTPPAVEDNQTGAQGGAAKYAREDHTHASKVRKKVQSGVNTATYTWVYPTAFASGVVPMVSAIAQVPNGNTDLFNVQVMGSPTNTQCVFQINRVTAGLLALLLGALSINSTPANLTLHMLALEP